MPNPSLVSIHGCHSGEFCSHSQDSLAAMVAAYAEQGFEWIGITEHMPAARDEMTPPEERAAGMNAADEWRRFQRYFETGRSLQSRYATTMDIYLGFETEAYSDAFPFIERIKTTFKPDFVVGSVHHVNDILIDGPQPLFEQAIASAGGLNELICAYFDRQLDLIEAVQPAVIGHFDLIRMNVPDYRSRFLEPAIWARISRNLATIAANGMILDFNVSALRKGSDEPYVTAAILAEAMRRGIKLVPGDDSHGVSLVGAKIREGIEILASHGASTEWARPV